MSDSLPADVIEELRLAREAGRFQLADAASKALTWFTRAAAEQRDTISKAGVVVADVPPSFDDAVQYQLRLVIREFDGFRGRLEQAATSFDREGFTRCAAECRRILFCAREGYETVKAMLGPQCEVRTQSDKKDDGRSVN